MTGMNRWSFLPALIILLVILILSSFTAGDGQFSYYGFANGANLSLDGTAQILPGGLLQLTNGTTSIQGHAFHQTPLYFRKSPNVMVQSFSASLVFGIITDIAGLSSDGITFFIAPTRNLSHAFPAQYLGLFNDKNIGNSSNHIFAVELDTVRNTEFRDIDSNHIGINLNGLSSMESQPAGFYDDRDGYLKNVSLMSGEAMQVWVDYNGEVAQINVTLAPFKMAKPNRPLLSASYNLSTVLTDVAYVGLSSSTGSISSRHYILGWSFTMNGPAPPFCWP